MAKNEITRWKSWFLLDKWWLRRWWYIFRRELFTEGSRRAPQKFLKRHNFLHGSPKENHLESYIVRKVWYSSITFFNLARIYELWLYLWLGWTFTRLSNHPIRPLPAIHGPPYEPSISSITVSWSFNKLLHIRRFADLYSVAGSFSVNDESCLFQTNHISCHGIPGTMHSWRQSVIETVKCAMTGHWYPDSGVGRTRGGSHLPSSTRSLLGSGRWMAESPSGSIRYSNSVQNGILLSTSYSTCLCSL